MKPDTIIFSERQRELHNITIVLIERFSDRSRVCALDKIAGPGKSLFIFSFSRDYYSYTRSLLNDYPAIKGLTVAQYHRKGLNALRFVPLGIFARLIRELLGNNTLQRSDKTKLLRFCIAQCRGIGEAVRLFLDAADLIRYIRDTRADSICCYSAKGFPLIPFISSLLNIEYTEYIGSGVQYFGEFAFELFAVVPYAYWLQTNNRLRFSISSKDTRCLYYFSPHHEELPGKRSYVPITEYPVGEMDRDNSDVARFPTILDTTRWIPPPYKEIYKNRRFLWDKEPCIICNKYTTEQFIRKRGIFNYLSLDALTRLIGLLQQRYHIIYNRPLPEDIVQDHQEEYTFNDFQAIRDRFPHVTFMKDLLKENPDLSFNELQMNVFANCSRFISVLGGSSYLASYFGGKNIIFAKVGWEIPCNAYNNWFHKFSGAQIFHVNNDRDLIATVQKEFLNP